MQPPPRKVKETQEVKSAFAEQVNWLQSKHQLESEMLEDIRSFSKQRAAIEKEYGQALQRLAAQYQKKDVQRAKGDFLNSGKACAVWRSLVEATAHSGTLRVSAAEGYRMLCTESVKNARATKEQRAKRGLEQLQQVQGELVESLRELNKVKKSYWQLGHLRDVAREKMADAQARSRKSDHGIFNFSRSGLQKLNTKLSVRLAECEQGLLKLRNEYLLTLAATNSHYQHYHATELPSLMQRIDGDLYEQLREQFTLLCYTETTVCQASKEEFGSIRKDVNEVTREQDLKLFIQEATSFANVPQFTFQTAPQDKVTTLQHQSSQLGGESCLEKEARKWASKVAKDYKIIAHGERVLHTLESRRRLLAEDAAAASVERKMEEVKENVRKAQVSHVQAESRLAVLVAAGVDVESWVSSSMAQAEEELEGERRLSEARKSTGDASTGEDEFDFTDFDDFDENGDTFAEADASSVLCGLPRPCRVLYSYQGVQVDELSITEGEELQVVEEGEMEDWVKARNMAGQEGYVPESYLHFLPWPEENDSSTSSCHILPHQARSFIRPRTSPCPDSQRRNTTLSLAGLARALYEYRGQSAEELSFPEGALIRLRRCCHGSVDDGFWEGELDGRVGVFPSLVVELLQEGEEEEDEYQECPPTPPPFPAPVLVSSISTTGCSSKHSTHPLDVEEEVCGATEAADSRWQYQQPELP